MRMKVDGQGDRRGRRQLIEVVENSWEAGVCQHCERCIGVGAAVIEARPGQGPQTRAGRHQPTFGAAQLEPIYPRVRPGVDAQGLNVFRWCTGRHRYGGDVCGVPSRSEYYR